ncbi:MAG: hypothetical protein R3C17_05705 [Planctomycetaceae bacterium]
MFRFDILSVLLLLTQVGCNQSSQIVQYEVERESDKVLTTDLLRDQFDPIPFAWKVPAGWTEAENDQFSAMAWAAGPKSDPARITVSGLSAASGLEAQIVRWRGQLRLPEMAVPEVMKSVEDVTLKGTTGKWCEFKNDTESILGMIVPHQDKLWIIKYRSSNETAAKERDAFRSFCESLQVE